MLKKIAWRLMKSIVGTSFEREYEEARRLEPQHALKHLLLHAHDNVPYYHNILERADVVTNGRVNLANFDQTPILTKEIIRNRAAELISRDYKRRDWFFNYSGGSTGDPVRFVQDRLFAKWIEVTSKYYYEDILGIRKTFAKKILLWSARDIFAENFGLRARTAKTIYNALTNTMVLDCQRMTETDMKRYVIAINSYEPKIIKGYANALYEICKFVEKRNLAIHTPTVVVSGAEMLRADLRNKIEAVLGTKVYDVYGSREVDGIAGECRCGLLHIFMFNNYLEVLRARAHQKVNEDENGRVIVTTLHNFSMPLIRYDVGDMAVLGPEKCKCGKPLPTLKKVIGRVCCFFKKEDGTIIDDGYFMGIFAKKQWIKAFRIIQEDYKKIRIMIVPKEGTIEASEKIDIEEKIKLVMGKDCKLKWEVLDEIPKTKMGKYLYTQSLLSG